MINLIFEVRMQWIWRKFRIHWVPSVNRKLIAVFFFNILINFPPLSLSSHVSLSMFLLRVCSELFSFLHCWWYLWIIWSTWRVCLMLAVACIEYLHTQAFLSSLILFKYFFFLPIRCYALCLEFFFLLNFLWIFCILFCVCVYQFRGAIFFFLNTCIMYALTW